MLSSRSSWRHRIIIRRDDLNFLRGLEERYLSRWDGGTSRLPGCHLKMREPMLSGPASGFPTSGSGSTRPRAAMAERIHGGDVETRAVPVPSHGRILNPPDDVDAHPSGASPFGVMDMVGNVWQWTDEYVGRTYSRSASCAGGSYYQPQGSIWYFPQAYRNDRTWQAVADGTELRSLGHTRLPVR